MKKKITTLLSLFAILAFLGVVAHAAATAPKNRLADCETCSLLP